MTLTLYSLFAYIGIAAIVVTIIRYFIEKPLSVPVLFIQNFIGLFFIFSGFVKSVDPLGTSYKIQEYFVEFGLGFLEDYTLAISIVTIVMEIVLGVTLLLGYMINATVWLLLLLILFFTFLTGYTTFTGKVTDCGCFGDFLKIEPVMSFSKDLFLTVLILFLFVRRKYIEEAPKMLAAPITIIATVAFTIFCFRNFAWNEPIFDFRPYKVGKNIPKQMKPIKPKVVEYVWEYKDKGTGEIKKFPDKEFAQISREPGFKDKWQYVNREDKIIDPGIPAPISNFAIFNENGEDLTDQILYENEGYQFLVIAYNLDKTHPEAFREKLNPIATEAEIAGITFFAVSASSPDQREAFRHENQTPYPFYEADGTFLKTITRSNPGLLLIKQGVVIGKWHHGHIPPFEEIKRDYLK